MAISVDGGSNPTSIKYNGSYVTKVVYKPTKNDFGYTVWPENNAQLLDGAIQVYGDWTRNDPHREIYLKYQTAENTPVFEFAAESPSKADYDAGIQARFPIYSPFKTFGNFEVGFSYAKIKKVGISGPQSGSFQNWIGVYDFPGDVVLDTPDKYIKLYYDNNQSSWVLSGGNGSQTYTVPILTATMNDIDNYFSRYGIQTFNVFQGQSVWLPGVGYSEENLHIQIY